MTRDEMNDRLRRMGLNQARMCRAMGLSRTAPTHWGDKVPGYIEAYLIALEKCDDAARIEAIHEACVAQKSAAKSAIERA